MKIDDVNELWFDNKILYSLNKEFYKFFARMGTKKVSRNLDVKGEFKLLFTYCHFKITNRAKTNLKMNIEDFKLCCAPVSDNEKEMLISKGGVGRVGARN